MTREQQQARHESRLAWRDSERLGMSDTVFGLHGAIVYTASVPRTIRQSKALRAARLKARRAALMRQNRSTTTRQPEKRQEVIL